MKDEFSLAQIFEVSDKIGGGSFLRYHLAPDHASRTAALEDLLEFAYDELMKNKHLYGQCTEDQLSVLVVLQLRAMAVAATHDTQTNGHCDIHVEGADHFLWIGEAKVHSGNKWLSDGFLQLATRYSTGGYGQDRGEIIIYYRQQKAAVVLRSWMNAVGEMEGVQVTEDLVDQRLWFRTQHMNVASGTPFFTRHRIIPLYFEPQK